MSPRADVEAKRPLFKLLGLVTLSAIFAGTVAFTIYGVREWPLRAGSLLEMAGLIWAALVVLGIGGAWLVARGQASSSSKV
jgi:hypothetical protein